MASVLAPLSQKHGVSLGGAKPKARKHLELGKAAEDQRAMEKQALIMKNKGRIEEQMLAKFNIDFLLHCVV